MNVSLSRDPVVPVSLRRFARRAARRLLPRRWLTAPVLHAALGLRVDHGHPVDCVEGLAIEYSFASIVGDLLYLHGTFERAESAFIAERLGRCAPGAVMVDVGANIGWHSLHATRVGGVGRVIAFEPARTTFEILRRNILRNGLAGKIEPVPVALSDRNGTAKFHCCADDAYSSLTPDARRPTAEIYEVPTATLDDWLELHRVDRIDFLKIDVEGNEPAVIAGARHTLMNRRPELVMEVYEGTRSGFSAERLIAAVCNCGYTPFVLRNGEAIPFERHDDAWFNYFFEPKR